MVQLIIRDNPGLDEILSSRPGIEVGRLLSGGYLVINVPENEVAAMTAVLEHTKIDSYSLVVGLMGKSANDAAGITPIQQQPYLDLRGSGVLLGFADTGIDYTKSAFLYENNTSRVRYIWDQSIEGPGPDGYGFGTEFSNDKLNDALAAENPFEIVPHKDYSGHGTVLAAMAGGREPGENIGVAPDAEFIIVKLRKANKFYLDTYLIPPDPENAFESIDVMQGIEYITQKAEELGRPVAVCISVGTNQGGHDGFTMFEEYLTYISHKTGVVLCGAAGNEGNTAHHTSGVIAKTDDEQRIEFNAGVSEGSLTVSIINNASDRISVSVISPTGEMVGRVPAKNGLITTEQLIFEKSEIKITYHFPVEGSGGQLTRVRISDATPGIWTILAHGDIIISGAYDAWLPITGFVSPDVEFLSPNPGCTIVVPASAMGIITCGAFNSRDNSIYSASSRGPTRLPSLMPDITAPGVEESGMTGTSVAAAVTAGACALLLQWGIANGNEPLMDTYLARADLIRGAKREPGQRYPNNQWGYGRLDLENTFMLMKRT